ncbi:glycosyltransferase family 2 protein [Thermococcus litoralis]|uniref:glycosyltransferase family 2 protein n=1 Tax=Thermococcus litoralis TaxID=2265 RepID=UPI000B357AD9|nr:glycosyltransferase family 2 protein [Thermococcus litoralis]
MEYPRVSVIILNWNGWKDTIECLESLYRITYPNYDVIVVDNGSTDDSIQKIREYAEGKIQVNSKFFEYNPENKPIKVFEITEKEAKQGKFNRPFYEKYDVDRRMILIKNKDNYGFAGGNNIGIKFALSVLNPDYVLLLNNDTIVDKEFLSELVTFAEKDKKIGSLQPKLIWLQNPALLDSAGLEYSKNGFGFDRGKFRPITEYKNPEEIFGSCGAAAMYRSKVLLEVAPNGDFLDPLFFCYYEDIDLAFRLRWAGWRSYYAPSSVVYHHRGKTGGNVSDFNIYHSLRNHAFCFIKNMPLTVTNSMLGIVGSLLFATYNVLLRKKVRAVATAYIDIAKNLPTIIKKRRRINRTVSDEEINRVLVLKWRAYQ